MVGNGCNSKRDQMVTHLEQRNATDQTTTTGAIGLPAQDSSVLTAQKFTHQATHQPVPDGLLITHLDPACVLRATGKNRNHDFVVDKIPVQI